MMKKLFHFVGLVLIFCLLTANAKYFEHSYVRIYSEGVVKQDIKLSDEEWDAIILAVDYALVRVQAVIDLLNEGAVYSEEVDEGNLAAAIGVNSAIHLLTLVKIATPTFEVHEQVGSEIVIRRVKSLLIVSRDERGDERIVDVPLLRAFLVNANMALNAKDYKNAKLFLENAQEASLYEDDTFVI